MEHTAFFKSEYERTSTKGLKHKVKTSRDRWKKYEQANPNYREESKANIAAADRRYQRDVVGQEVPLTHEDEKVILTRMKLNDDWVARAHIVKGKMQSIRLRNVETGRVLVIRP